MTIILETLEMFPNNVEAMGRVVAKSLDDWVASHEGAENLNIKATVKMEEKVSFVPPLGSTKCARIFFTDKWSTEVVFHIRKKTRLESLRALAAAAVVDCVEKEDDIVRLEIPITLFSNLVKKFRNDWSAKYFRDQMQKQEKREEQKKSRKKCCQRRKSGSTFSCQICGLHAKCKGGLTRHKNAKH